MKGSFADKVTKSKIGSDWQVGRSADICGIFDTYHLDCNSRHSDGRFMQTQTDALSEQ
jgi:hypothetical protein